MGQSESKFVATALAAVRANATEKLRDLIVNHKQYINSHDPSGNTLLKTAVVYSKRDIVHMLIEEGADVNAPDARGIAPIHYAVMADDEDITEILLNSGALVNGRNDNYETPLTVAISHNSLTITDMLLAKGANPNISDSIQNSPLHIACANGNRHALTALFEKGKDVYLDSVNIEGYTPLLLCIKNGYEDMALALCERDADVKIPGGDGVTPLLAAVQRGYVELVRVILAQEGVDKQKGDRNDLTPLVASLESGYGRIACMLIKAGVLVDGRSNATKVPLHVATQKGLKEAVVCLLDYGADVRERNKDNMCALVYAAEYEQDEILGTLLERGAVGKQLGLEGASTGMYPITPDGNSPVITRAMPVSSSPSLFGQSFPSSVASSSSWRAGGAGADDTETFEAADDLLRAIEISSANANEKIIAKLVNVTPKHLMTKFLSGIARKGFGKTAGDDFGDCEGNCIICYEAERDAVLVPCGHLSTCITCIQDMPASLKQCPICRSTFTLAQKIFKV
eukprot:TRINITY_DN3592_c0_g1_i1.p1 TRINITY_DN3592_c0_g1~~TRINITY_DN3592_c0_g1_i1.p1  ORF type:complete len:512 (-),score=91.12 TRINITY_DN3592_c0_g1_i1:110-1645(-)